MSLDPFQALHICEESVWSISLIQPAMRSLLCRHAIFTVLNFAVLFLVGCGATTQDEREHLPLHGSITQNGSPAGNGAISFIPAKENSNGSPASTNILSGKYRFSDSEGPSPGQYRVRINPPLPTKDTTQVENPISGGPWEFELTVTEDLAEGGADFDLSDKNKKIKKTRK